MDTIPCIDFSLLSVKCSDYDINDLKVKDLAAQIGHAFRTIGFVCLVNHGIDESTVSALNATAKEFFNQPVSTKKKYQRQGDTNHGWVSLEQESLNPERPGDLKEAYNVTSTWATSWPDQEVPMFKPQLLAFQAQCEDLAQRVLQMMALDLVLDDPNFFKDRHSPVAANVPSYSTLRCLYYPPLPSDWKVKAGQVRCGEHSDYGSITLLFQDLVGGLEVKDVSGEWKAATPIPGAVLINVGDLMERWTCDELVSTKHRVLIPQEEVGRQQARQSIAYFFHPDDSCIIQPVDGSNKYPPISAGDYTKMRFGQTY